MSEIKICEVRCPNCRKWFSSKIAQFEDAETFRRAITYKNAEPCPYCKTMISHDKEIMRFLEKDNTGKVIRETRCIYNF
ncbi:MULTISPECIES: hypothetical protein [Methanosarcina]|jgi:hypothetical protein|uniref:Uncharacterized protein n=4 Tax=Methanosarcina mazei TaxID=2209 RepID=A0A0F8HYU6_METMZ|nr:MULTISPECIES: hypothetical protein [Methanosarcina]AAM31156.1 conserved protein [Methanosarcina mazei Go1]AKB42204.1 hypothetical protein MSMAW_3213 [Methanosarcina mazei WWM610]AKB73116.1 hypothetical protein MSMAC_3226 [Methanosarcina mazei C16]KKG81876.1 hypothetical protein DU61_05625 [Methanosarcina mazei]MDO5841080.1 hypothetical protein [Methanosarcina mazei]